MFMIKTLHNHLYLKRLNNLIKNNYNIYLKNFILYKITPKLFLKNVIKVK